MKIQHLLGFALYCCLPHTTTCIKLNPKIVTAKLTHCSNKSNRKPAAFVTKNAPELQQQAQTSQDAFMHQLIILPAIMKMTTTFLVPCTKEVCEFVSTALEETAQGISKVSSTVATNVNDCICKVPGKVNSLAKMCGNMVKNTAEAILEFSENVADGFVDGVYGTKAWCQTICSFTYNKALMPCVKNCANFISQVTEDCKMWFQSATLHTYRFVSKVVADIFHATVQFSLDSADWVQYYSTLSFQVLMSAVRTIVNALFQIILNVPVWLNLLFNVSLEFLASMVNGVKKGLINLYYDALDLIDIIIDKVPFLIRYEENGVDKVALSPNAQMVLYLLSTIYASQPLWDNVSSKSTSSSSSTKNRKIIGNVVSNISTRFFPPRTLFFAGALARGLHQSSTLVDSFHPTVGVGSIINFSSAALEERWINYIVAGWYFSGSLWPFFGSKAPQKVSAVEEGTTKKGFW